MCSNYSNYYSVIVLSLKSSKYSSSSASSLLCLSCASKRRASYLLLYRGFMTSYGYSKRDELSLGFWWSILALGGADIEASILLSKSLGIDPRLWLF